MAEHEYWSEKRTRERVWYYAKKHGVNIMLKRYIFEWFDGQIDIGDYLGISYRLLYRKDTDLDTLFKEACID